MAAFAAIALLDGQATPVSHTFSPSMLTSDALTNTAVLQDRSSGVGIGFGELNITFSRPKAGAAGAQSMAARLYKVKVSIAVPALETVSTNTINGVQAPPTVAFTDKVNIEFFLPERTTAARRADILAYAKNVLASTAVDVAVKTLEPIF